MEKEPSDSIVLPKRNWRDYFDVFKYFIPFFIYFIIIWLNANFATTSDLADVQLTVSHNAREVMQAQESTKDLRTEMLYEIKLIDEKLLTISKDLAEIKELVDKK